MFSLPPVNEIGPINKATLEYFSSRSIRFKMIRIILLSVVGSVISAPNYDYDYYNYNDISQSTTTKAPTTNATTTKATTQAATTKAPTAGKESKYRRLNYKENINFFYLLSNRNQPQHNFVEWLLNHSFVVPWIAR